MEPIALGAGARDGAVGRGAALQAGRFRVRLPMGPLEFFIDLILPALVLTQPLRETSTRIISWEVKTAGAKQPVASQVKLSLYNLYLLVFLTALYQVTYINHEASL